MPFRAYLRVGTLSALYQRISKSMITLEDFMTSSFEKKCDLVINSTQYLMSRKLGEATVYLYQSENFFVEVYYSSKYKKVLMINAFDDVYGLHVYADSISLADIGY